MHTSGIIGIIVGGLIIGALGRLIMPGRQPIGCLLTIFIGVLPMVVVIFGKPELLAGEKGRWEAAILLLFVNAADLFGGYAFNIALSRRMFDVSAPSGGA